MTHDRLHITDADLKMYHCLYEAVSNTPYTLKKLIPTFLISETIFFFEKLEQYEKCKILKEFFDKHPNKRLSISRVRCLKQINDGCDFLE